MRLRLALFLAVTAALAAVDLLVDARVPAASWEFHHRTSTWIVLATLFLAGLALLALLPSLTCAVAAGIVAGGVLGSLVSAAMHGGGVADPLVAGGTAFNLGDVFVIVGLPVLMVPTAATAIRHRDAIDRRIPPRRWEHHVRRKLGL